MNILFIQPLWTYRKKTKSIFRYLAGIYPPLGIALLSAILEEEGHNVRIIDCIAESINPDEINDHIHEKYDIVGITAFTNQAPSAYKLAKNIKHKFKDSIIILGGIHATILPEEVIGNPYIDICVRSEGEETVKEIVSGLKLDKIKGISYKNEHGENIHNSDRKYISNIDAYPLPAYHLLPMRKYHSNLGLAIREPSIGILVSRGCPNNCEYCYPHALGRKVRMKSSIKIMEEIILLKEKYGIREIDFYDDTFTVFQNKIVEICNLLIENKIDIVWSCCTRADYITENLLTQMKKAGCHNIQIGVESGSSKVRNAIGKNINVDYHKVFTKAKKAGIQVRATYMIGNYIETRNDILETIDFSKRINSELAIFNITTPYPGTLLYKRLEKEGRIKTNDWEKYDFYNVVFRHPNLSEDEIQELYKRAIITYYFRIIVMIRVLKKVIKPSIAKLIIYAIFNTIRGIIQWR